MNVSRFTRRFLTTVPAALALGACSVMPPAQFPRMESVNVDRYMGGWFVIAHIPPGVVADSYNNIERYRRGAGDRIETVYTYREGSFDGEAKRMEPTGFVLDESNGSVWAMQFIWPIKMEYTIAYVDPAYETTMWRAPSEIGSGSWRAARVSMTRSTRILFAGLNSWATTSASCAKCHSSRWIVVMMWISTRNRASRPWPASGAPAAG